MQTHHRPAPGRSRTRRDAPVLQGPDLRSAPRLYPAIEPRERFHLPVGDGHELYVELCGNPRGRPALVGHASEPALFVSKSGKRLSNSDVTRRLSLWVKNAALAAA